MFASSCKLHRVNRILVSTHVSISRLVSVTFPGRSIGARHRKGVADMVALYVAIVRLRVRVVAGVATIAEIIYNATHTCFVMIVIFR